ncbi:MAG: ORF6N domain-containing protein [Bacteroidia bacterium]
MKNAITFEQIEDKIIFIHNQQVILDSDVAKLYGVETKEINQAVKNNPDKFPEGYILITPDTVKTELVKNFDRFNKLKHSSILPNAFTEKGLYMLATILKSPTATQTTIAILETFAKVRLLSQTITELSENPEGTKQKSLMAKSGEIITELFSYDKGNTDTETSIELNFAVI